MRIPLFRLKLEKLPASFQAEVLDFVEYLLAKAERQENGDWSELSLAFAMRGMEDEGTPAYTNDDIKVAFG